MPTQTPEAQTFIQVLEHDTRVQERLNNANSFSDLITEIADMASNQSIKIDNAELAKCLEFVVRQQILEVRQRLVATAQTAAA